MLRLQLKNPQHGGVVGSVASSQIQYNPELG